MKVYVVEEGFRYEGGTVEAVYTNENQAIEFAKSQMDSKNIKVQTFDVESEIKNDRKITYIEYEKESRMTFYTVEEFKVIVDENYIEGFEIGAGT